MYKFFAILLFETLVSVSAVFCGPFGLDMGMSLAQIKQKTGNAPVLQSDDLYIVTPPNTNNLFGIYAVRVHPEYGVYSISAIGKDITTTGYGLEVKSAFNDLVGSIEKTYGKYKKYDFLQARSIWDEPNDFMMGLVKSERHLAAFWDKGEGSALPEDISAISVTARGLSSSKGYIILQYSSPKAAIADAEKKAKGDAVF
jgi:hypothetical protein